MRMIVLAALVAFHLGCAEAEEPALSERELKLAIEEASGLVVCAGGADLEILGMDIQQCLTMIPMVAPSCWLGIDKLVPNYQIPTTDAGKEKFFDIAYIFNKCVRSELLEQVGRDLSDKPS